MLWRVAEGQVQGLPADELLNNGSLWAAKDNHADRRIFEKKASSDSYRSSVRLCAPSLARRSRPPASGTRDKTG